MKETCPKCGELVDMEFTGKEDESMGGSYDTPSSIEFVVIREYSYCCASCGENGLVKIKRRYSATDPIPDYESLF
jgi:rRNA maturation protein Nop10